MRRLAEAIGFAVLLTLAVAAGFLVSQLAWRGLWLEACAVDTTGERA